MGAASSAERGPQVIVSEPQNENETGVYRHVDAKDGLWTHIDKDVRTLYEAFQYV